MCMGVFRERERERECVCVCVIEKERAIGSTLKIDSVSGEACHPLKSAPATLQTAYNNIFPIFPFFHAIISIICPRQAVRQAGILVVAFFCPACHGHKLQPVRTSASFSMKQLPKNDLTSILCEKKLVIGWLAFLGGSHVFNMLELCTTGA